MTIETTEALKTRQQLGHLIPQLKAWLELKTIQNADQAIGAFLLGNQHLKQDQSFAGHVEQLGTSFLKQYQSSKLYNYTQLCDVLNSLASVQSPDVATPLAGRLVGVLLQADIDAAQNHSLLAQYDQFAKQYLNEQ